LFHAVVIIGFDEALYKVEEGAAAGLNIFVFNGTLKTDVVVQLSTKSDVALRKLTRKTIHGYDIT